MEPNKEEWQKWALKQVPKNLPGTYAGCWLEGEWAGYSKCMANEVARRDKEIQVRDAKIAELEKENVELTEAREDSARKCSTIIVQLVNNESENERLKSELDKAKELLKRVDEDYSNWTNLCKIQDFLKNNR